MSSSVSLPASEAISKNSLAPSLTVRLADRPKFSLGFLCAKGTVLRNPFSQLQLCCHFSFDYSGGIRRSAAVPLQAANPTYVRI